MAYATQDQIQFAAGGPDRFTSLADWDNDRVPDADVIAKAQSRADGWIDGYLRLRYTTPIANPTMTVIEIAADECVYQIKAARGLAFDPSDVDRRKDRERTMEAMRDGKLRPDDPLPQKSAAVKGQFIENCSPMSRRNLRDM